MHDADAFLGHKNQKNGERAPREGSQAEDEEDMYMNDHEKGKGGGHRALWAQRPQAGGGPPAPRGGPPH